MNRYRTIAAACALALACSAAAGGDKQDDHALKQAESAAQEQAYSDRMFFETAAAGGMAEVDAGKLASARGNSKDVRGFGAMMVTDHTKKNEELKQLATEKNVALPVATDAEHLEMLAKLQGLSGDAFDREYADDMVQGHEAMAALLEQAARESKDGAVRKFASDTLVVVRQHHELAVDLEKTEVAEAHE